ncbi:uncharacterized protein LOC144094470 [Amblyomma americanum]
MHPATSAPQQGFARPPLRTMPGPWYDGRSPGAAHPLPLMHPGAVAQPRPQARHLHDPVMDTTTTQGVTGKRAVTHRTHQCRYPRVELMHADGSFIQHGLRIPAQKPFFAPFEISSVVSETQRI